MYVRYGDVTVGKNTVVHAGNEAWIAGDGLVDEPKAAYPDALEAQAGKPIEIFYDRDVPPVRFVVPRKGRDAAAELPQLQWSKDENFDTLEAAEVLRSNSFARDRLPEGRTFWRATDRPDAVGEIAISPDDNQPCLDCRVAQTVQDSGDRVVLRYENLLPRVTLEWASTASDASDANVVLSIFKDSDLRTPVLSQTLTGHRFLLPDQLLKDGSYHWYVQRPGSAVTKDPASAINTLSIEHETHTDGLILTTPTLGQRVRQRRLRSKGRVAAGAKLYLNGRAVPVRRDGSFKVPVKLKVGRNRLIYRITQPQEADRYYIRDVTFHHR
jgi:hypothetical protein